MFEPLATATVKWLPPSEGGRPAPPTGPTYSATAVLSRDDDDYEPVDYFSIVLRFDDRPEFGVPHHADLDFLAPELVLPALEVGHKIIVMEGTRPVAICEIESLGMPSAR